MNYLCCVKHPESQILEILIGNEEYSNLSIRKRIDLIEIAMKGQEQVAIPVGHAFSDGIYLRQVFIPKGTLLISKYHKQGQIDVMLSGDMSIVTNDGVIRVQAPMVGQSQPGMRRLGYAHEDTLWVDIRKTDETDINALEKWLYAETYEEFEKDQIEKCREDYEKVLLEYGFCHETARDQSINTSDQIIINLESYGLYTAESKIHGEGLFAKKLFSKGDFISPARIQGMRTQAGRYTNHSIFPTAEMILSDNGDVSLCAIHNIYNEDEITIDYRKSLSLSGLHPIEKGEALCRELQQQ